MESDRMGHLLGAVTQEKLDQQRGVVQNEKRQGDNQPYGIVDYEAQDALFPVGHPYRHSTIGSMRSEEHTSELQSLMRISYAAFCLKKKIQPHEHTVELMCYKRHLVDNRQTY